MKILIAADGNTLDSRLSKRFGKAQWYLIVDDESLDVKAAQNVGPRDHHDIVPKAAAEGVETVITGNIGPRSYELMSSNNLKVALARNISAREALERLKKNDLRMLDAPTLKQSVEEHELHRRERRQQFGKGGARGRGKQGFVSVTPRGRHHLQQYGGRGH